MEWHIKCDPKEISRYIFCPGDQKRAKKIADMFDTSHLVTESRGYIVYSGEYKGVFMTVCGTGMGGPAVAIGIEELAHMGADPFIRVGSCGVFQEGQKPGDVIAASGTVRAGGTANSYLPPIYPAVPTFAILRKLVESAEELNIPLTVGGESGRPGPLLYRALGSPAHACRRGEAGAWIQIVAVLARLGWRAPAFPRPTFR